MVFENPKEFLAIRRAISLNETFVLFCWNNDLRNYAHSTNIYRRAVDAPLPPNLYIQNGVSLMHVITLLLIEWEFISVINCACYSVTRMGTRPLNKGKQSSYHAMYSKTIYTVDVQ